jgi:RHS repeat-associated protein
MLNLPRNITGSGFNMTYTYDANGDKLNKNNGTVSTDYIDGIQYDNGIISFVQTEEGRAIISGSGNNYEYSLTDHLGNSRLTFDTHIAGSATTVQQDDYMPFGMEIVRGSITYPKNEYLYNKKEKQEETGNYDYGARFYDPLISRWTSIDPLAEKYDSWSAYNYVKNNPVKLIDPDGKEIVNGSKQGTKEYEDTQSALKILSKSNPEAYETLNSSKTKYVITVDQLNPDAVYKSDYTGKIQLGLTTISYSSSLDECTCTSDATGDVSGGNLGRLANGDEQDAMRASGVSIAGVRFPVSQEEAEKKIKVDGDVSIQLDKSLVKDLKQFTITLGHEFGHAAFADKNKFLDFLWKAIGSKEQQGHDKNNPSGKRAIEEAEKAKKNYRKAKKEVEDENM